MIRYHAAWVLPISSPPIRGGTVCVENGRIAFVGARSDAPRGEDRDLGDAVLLPGLVNVHSHLELTAMRGFLEDLPFRDWIARLHRAKRAVLTGQRLLDSACGGIAEGLLHGITTYGDTCDTGVSFDAMNTMHVRGVMYQEVFAPDPAECTAALEGLRAKVDDLRARANDRVGIGISPHAPYTVCDDLFRGSAEYARAERLPIAVHIAESEVERELVRSGAGMFADGLRDRGIAVAARAESPVKLLARLGVLDCSPLLVHCVRVDEHDLELIAGSGSSVAHCPVANAKLGHGIAPVARMLELGIRVALGSDSVAANNRMDLLEEARVASLMQRAVLGRPDVLPSSRALEMVTVEGARALGLADRVGTIEAGKDADLAAFDLSVAGGALAADPTTALVFSLGGSRAKLATVGGRELVRDGKLVDADAVALSRRVDEVARELWRWEGSRGQSP